jgi:hypothetical protein
MTDIENIIIGPLVLPRINHLLPLDIIDVSQHLVQPALGFLKEALCGRMKEGGCEMLYIIIIA